MQCVGGNDSHFSEYQQVPLSVQGKWAECLGKRLLSNGVADGTCPLVLAQLAALHPSRKEEIPSPTSAQIQAPRTSIDREVFDATLLDLQSMTAPGLELLRNEHLTALVFNPNRQVSPLARSALDQLFRLLNLIAYGSLPWYFFVLFYSIRQDAGGCPSPDPAHWYRLRIAPSPLEMPPSPLFLSSAGHHFTGTVRCWGKGRRIQAYHQCPDPPRS